MAPLPQFVLFGDSITQGASDQSMGFGLAAELQTAYVRRFDVINRGYSGYNTDHAIDIITRALPTPEQASMKFLSDQIKQTIWFGANDANKNPTQGQYVPAERYKSNLLAIINHPAVQEHSPNIILITPPPFEESLLADLQKKWGATGETRKAKDAQAYAEIVKQVGKEAGVPVVDAWGLCMEKTGWKGDVGETLPGGDAHLRNAVLADLLHDGLHLGPPGYKIVFDGLIAVMKKHWPEFPPYKMPFTEKVSWEIELGDQMWDVNNDL